MTAGETEAGYIRQQNGSTKGKQSPNGEINSPITYHQPTIDREGYHRQTNPAHCPKSKGARRDETYPHSDDDQDDHANSKGGEKINTNTTDDRTKQDT